MKTKQRRHQNREQKQAERICAAHGMWMLAEGEQWILYSRKTGQQLGIYYWKQKHWIFGDERGEGSFQSMIQAQLASRKQG